MVTSITVIETITVTVSFPFGVTDEHVDAKQLAIADAIRSVTGDRATTKAVTGAIFKACPLAKSVTTAISATGGDAKSVVGAGLVSRSAAAIAAALGKSV